MSPSISSPILLRQGYGGRLRRKNEPFSTGVWEIAPEVLDEAEKINEAAINRLRHCRFTDNWPTGYESVRVIASL